MTGFTISNTSNMNTPSSTSSTGVFGNTSSSAGIFSTEKKKVVLSQDDIGAMALCTPPLDPNNEDHVQMWLNMPEDQKNTLRNAYIESLNITTTEGESTTEGAQVPIEETPQKQEIKLPDNWAQLSTADKTKFIFDLLGEMKYGDDWASMPEDQKKNIVEQQLTSLAVVTDDQFPKMNEKDRSRKIEKIYLNIAAVLKDFDGKSIGNGELIAAMEDFAKLSQAEQAQKRHTVHHEIRQDTDITGAIKNCEPHIYKTASGKQEKKLKETIAEKNSCNVSDVTEQEMLDELNRLAKANNGKLPEEYQYLEHYYTLLKNKALLSYSGTIENDKTSVTTSLYDCFKNPSTPEDTLLILDTNGNIDRNSDTNIERINSYVLQNFKNEEEFKTFYNTLSGTDQTVLLHSLLGNKHALTSSELERLGLNKLTTYSAAVLSHPHASDDAQKLETIKYYQDTGLYNKENYHKLKSETSSREAQTYAGQKALEFGDEEDIGFYNKYTSLREDYQDIYTDLNTYVANSETISDDIKQFYAQNVIESAHTPEQRAWQSENLTSHNNEAFNTGVKTGLNNVANGETPTKAVTNDSEKVTQIINNTITLSEPAQQVYNSIDEFLQGNLQPEEIKAKFAELDNEEQIKLLKQYVTAKGDHIDVKLCDTFLELVPILVNNGKGLDVVAKCSMPVGNVAIKLLSTKDKKRLAIENPHRLSQGTYQALVADGLLKTKESSRNSYMAKA